MDSDKELLSHNPATLLHDLFADIKRTPEQKLKKQKLNVILQEVLETDSEANTLRRFSHFFDLPEQARRAIIKVRHIDTLIYLQWLTPVLSTFHNVSLNAPAFNFVAYIDKGVMTSLLACADQIRVHYNVILVEDDSRNELLIETKRLMELVESSNLEKVLKASIASRLLAIRDALLDYDLVGGAPLYEATERTYGAVLVDPVVGEAFITYREDPTIQEFWQYMGKTASALQVGDAVKQMIEAMWDKILGA